MVNSIKEAAGRIFLTGRPEKRRGLAAGIIFCALLYALMFFLNYCTPMLADDYNYSYMWTSDQRLDDVRNVPISIYLHWLYTNGRILSHFFAQIFLMFPRLLFCLINAAVPPGICLALYFILKPFCIRPGFGAALIFASLWLFTPDTGQVFLWLTGSCNYSWAILVILLFLCPYFRALSGNTEKRGFFTELLFLLISFAAGSYSENGSSSAIFIAFFIILYICISGKRFPLWLFLDLLAACAGFLFLFFAPSMQKGNRGSLSFDKLISFAETFEAKLGQAAESLGRGLCLTAGLLCLLLIIYFILVRKNRRLFYSSLMVCCCVFFSGALMLFGYIELRSADSNLPLTAVLLSCKELNLLTVSFIFALLLIMGFYRRLSPERLLLSLLLFAAAALSVLVFVFALYIPGRSFYCWVLYLSLAAVILSGGLVEKGSRIPGFIATVLAVLFCLSLVTAVSDGINIHMQDLERLEIISRYEGSGSNISLPCFAPKSKFSAAYGLEDLKPDPGSWINTMLGVYYSLGFVTGISPGS